MIKCFWNYFDDDDTQSLNLRLLGIIPPGLYKGFDPIYNQNWVFQLDQSQTGFEEVLKDNNTTRKVGIIQTRQGAIIRSDETHNVTIASSESQPRIDLIVCEFEYVEVQGGETIIIYAIKGTAASNPQPPSLNHPTKQVVLGELFIPANANNLGDSGVEFTKNVTPFFNGDAIPDDIARLNYNQEFTKRNTHSFGTGLYFSSQYNLPENNNVILNYGTDLTPTFNIHYLSDSPIGTRFSIFVNPGTSSNTSYIFDINIINDSNATPPFTSNSIKIYTPDGKNISSSFNSDKDFNPYSSFVIEVERTSQGYEVINTTHGSHLTSDWNTVGDTNAPSFNSGWGDNFTSSNAPRYLKFRKKLPENRVEIYGSAILTTGSSFTGSKTLFTLPADYRPTSAVYIMGTMFRLVNPGFLHHTPIIIKIDPAGVVTVYSFDIGTTINDSTYVVIDDNFLIE